MLLRKDALMYEIYFANFGYYSDDVFDTLGEAIEFGKNRGFEFSVFKDGDLVGYASGVNLSWHFCN
jgi:hypothetical protein